MNGLGIRVFLVPFLVEENYMISRERANQIQMYAFIIIVIAHIVYADIALDVDITKRIVFYAIGFSLVASMCLFVIKHKTWSEIGFIITSIVAAHLIGESLGTLPYSPVIYMLMSAAIVIIGDLRLSNWYITLVNLAIIYDVTTHHHIISRTLTLDYYVMLLLFCETMLFAQCFVVKLYQTKVQEIVERNQLLNKAQKSKDEFLANMSHEIRTPMNAIIGMTELIMREEDTSEKVQEYCYNIQSSGENLLAIINDILDFSKIESGKMNIYYEPYSIASVIQDVANTAMFRRGFKDVEIIIDCDPMIPKQLIGDVVRNRQILMNLVTNAVKYTEKGHVFISLSCYNKEGVNCLHMIVADTGIGIREEDKAHLFESFSRMDTTRNRSIEGTGLGLPLCKRLTQAMNGTIEVESEYGVGTVVKVDIPQEIEDESPFLTIHNADSMKIIVYGDWEQFGTKANDYYRVANTNTWSGFGVSYRVIFSFSELMKVVEQNDVTHIYTGMTEYADQRSYFERIAKTIKVFILYDPQYPIKLGPDIHGVQLPFYSVNLAASLNGESIYSQYIDKKDIHISFKAPFARVLIVDDNDVNLRVAEGVLKLYDVTCVLARSGKEAIELLKDQDIDIVFMDHMMPEMDGIEAAKIIRRVGGEYGRSLPIIALTANAVNDAKNLFKSNGFQDFIAKPISIKRVDSVLRRWLPGTKVELIDEKTKKQIPEFDDGIVLDEHQSSIFDIDESHNEKLVSDDKIDTNAEMKNSKSDVSVNDSALEQHGDKVPSDFVFMNINEEVALENMGQQRDLYKELLEYCLELEEQRKQEITESFEQQDWQEYAIRVHALKGGMRSLGVEELALAAQKMELAAKENRISDVLEGNAHLMEEYERGHRSIEMFLKSFHI